MSGRLILGPFKGINDGLYLSLFLSGDRFMNSQQIENKVRDSVKVS